MNWQYLTIVLLIVYAIYYAVNIALDLSKSTRKKEDKGERYNLDIDEEIPTTIYKEDFFETENPIEDFDQTNSKSENSEPTDSSRVEEKIFQSFSVDDFIKNAKDLSLGIEF